MGRGAGRSSGQGLLGRALVGWGGGTPRTSRGKECHQGHGGCKWPGEVWAEGPVTMPRTGMGAAGCRAERRGVGDAAASWGERAALAHGTPRPAHLPAIACHMCHRGCPPTVSVSSPCLLWHHLRAGPLEAVWGCRGLCWGPREPQGGLCFRSEGGGHPGTFRAGEGQEWLVTCPSPSVRSPFPPVPEQNANLKACIIYVVDKKRPLSEDKASATLAPNSIRGSRNVWGRGGHRGRGVAVNARTARFCRAPSAGSDRPSTCYINKVLLAHGHAHLRPHHLRWLSSWGSGAETSRQRASGLRSQRYLLSGVLQRTLPATWMSLLFVKEKRRARICLRMPRRSRGLVSALGDGAGGLGNRLEKSPRGGEV